MWVYNLSFFSFCKQDLEDICKVDFEFSYLVDINLLVWDKEDFIFYLSKKDYILSVVKSNGGIIGFCLSFISGKESELYKIIVLSDYRGRGIGKVLLAYHLNYLNFIQVNVSFLEVAENNHQAIKFYERFGYKRIGLRKGYYGSKDAFVMRKFLS